MKRTLAFMLLCLLVACTPSRAPDQSKQPEPTVDRAPASTPAAPERPAEAKPTSLDVLILGDSQISSGAGPSYLNFFGRLAQNCQGSALASATSDRLAPYRIRAVGVRSTALHSWIAQDGAPKDTICEVDKKFGVNAAAFGHGAPKGKRYIQIGQEPGFEYCRAGQSAFETVFSDPANTTKLLILSFLGNAQDRWANNPNTAAADLRETLLQIPQDVPCIIMTTAPVFDRAANDQRVIAQTNLARALENQSRQCGFVRGVTPQTRQAIEGQPRFFRQNAEGEVVDPLHPSSEAAEVFFNLNAVQICDAVQSAF